MFITKWKFYITDKNVFVVQQIEDFIIIVEIIIGGGGGFGFQNYAHLPLVQRVGTLCS